MSRLHLVRLLCCLVTVGGGWAEARGDKVYLKNGDVLTGTVVKFDAKALKLATEYAGDVTISAGEVERIATEGPVVLKLDSGREIAGRIVAGDDGAMEIDDGGGNLIPLSLSQVSSLAPPPPPRPWFRNSGEINLGFTGASGNTKTQGYHIAGQARPEFGRNTITISGQLNRSEATIDGSDETTASNWRVLGQYDRYLTDHWYWFLNNGWENDDLKDLNVRISTATGAGYKFWDDEMRYFTVELGPGFIYENFKRVQFVNDPEDPLDDVVVNPDRDYVTGRWALDFSRAVFDPGKRFFHNHILSVRADNADTFIFQSATGLRFNLIASINAGAEVQFDWNNDPADAAVKEDLRYLVTLGYAF